MTNARIAKATGAVIFSVVTTFLLVRIPNVDGPWTPRFRGFFSFDQLAYASIASTAASGEIGFVEPFTETGRSFYPSLWYRILGVISGTFNAPIFSVWSAAGLTVLLGAIALLGFMVFRISGCWWLPALVAPMLWIGPLAMVFFDTWFISLNSHAVLWGPYALLYTLNAEAVAMSAAAIGLAAMLWIATKSPSPMTRRSVAIATLASGLIGLLANIQTYAFLTATAVLAFWIAAWGLLKSQSRTALALTIGLTLIAASTGVMARDISGALPIYVLMVGAALPGAWMLVRYRVRLAVWPTVAFVLAASPQVVLTGWGTLMSDPFLAYRTEQSGELSVPLWAWLIATLPIAAVWLFVLLTSRKRTPLAVQAMLVSLAVAHVLLTFNQVWGFEQEPYRFWIDSVTLTAFLLPILAAWVLATKPLFVTRPLVGSAAITLTALSFWNVGGYREYAAEAGSISLDTPRWQAITALGEAIDGLLMAEGCLDPSLVKIATESPIAYFNSGIAWPERKGEIEAVMVATQTGMFDPDAARAAGVKYVMGDSACPSAWDLTTVMGVQTVSSIPYEGEQGTDVVSLWRIYY